MNYFLIALPSQDRFVFACISVQDLSAEECVIPDPENIEDEIRLLCSSNDKDTHQAGRGGRCRKCIPRGHFSGAIS